MDNPSYFIHATITMRIYRGKIKPISEDIVRELMESGDIEVPEDQVGEVILDIEAIIKAEILDTPGVVEILSFETDFDAALRKLTVDFEVSSDFGTVTISEQL